MTGKRVDKIVRIWCAVIRNRAGKGESMSQESTFRHPMAKAAARKSLKHQEGLCAAVQHPSTELKNVISQKEKTSNKPQATASACRYERGKPQEASQTPHISSLL